MNQDLIIFNKKESQTRFKITEKNKLKLKCSK